MRVASSGQSQARCAQSTAECGFGVLKSSVTDRSPHDEKDGKGRH